MLPQRYSEQTISFLLGSRILCKHEMYSKLGINTKGNTAINIQTGKKKLLHASMKITFTKTRFPLPKSPKSAKQTGIGFKYFVSSVSELDTSGSDVVISFFDSHYLFKCIGILVVRCCYIPAHTLVGFNLVTVY